MLEVLESAKWVCEKAKKVKIDWASLKALTRDWLSEGVEVPGWDDAYHFVGEGNETVSYLLILDSLNFCFWPAQGGARWEIEYGSESLSGYFALAASLKRAIESGIPITQADYLACLSIESLKGLLGGHGNLQLMGRRLEILRELGQVLKKDYGGEACRLVERAEDSAVGLARLLGSQLKSFNDVAEYGGRQVFFYKRAQIFTADLYSTFQGKSWGSFKDMDQLTAFADYKLPQVLRQLGILGYEKDLAKKVDEGILLEQGGPEEVEIRASTIWVVEGMRQEMVRGGKDLKAHEIDWILWSMGQRDRYRTKPYHKVMTIFY